jgi:hypothetical protein
MAKTVLAKKELEHIALVEVRACCGCDDVVAVLIDAIAQVRRGPNWKIVILKRGGAGALPANQVALSTARAINIAHGRLREIYDLRID